MRSRHGVQGATSRRDARHWSGFYIGLHGGGMWGNFDATMINFNSTRFFWGGQAGHNWQYRNLVVGLEADLSAPVGTDSKTIGDTSISGQLKYLGSVRARFGYLVTPDLLLFATGGPGFGRGEIKAPSIDLSAVHFGGVAGGGIEYMLGRNLTARVEAMKYWLGGATYLIVPATVNPTVARVAVNLKF
jgi:outer membrane immunogenic protein